MDAISYILNYTCTRLRNVSLKAEDFLQFWYRL